MNVHLILIRPLKHSVAALTAVLAASMGLAQMAAAAPPVTRVYVVVVPPAQDHAFNVGMKAWEKCLRGHGETQATYTYDAETGDVSRYLFLNGYNSWGAMDAHDPAGNACQVTFRTAVLPHFTQGFSDVAELNAKDTYMPADDPNPAPIMWVAAFRIKFGYESDFHEGMEKFAAAAAKTHWQGHFAGYDIDGAGQGAEDFVVVWPNKNWADVGQEPTPSSKDLMYSVYGKAAADAMYDKFRASVKDQWQDAWSYDKDLSIIPRK
jgi:hypothetical protein